MPTVHLENQASVQNRLLYMRQALLQDAAVFHYWKFQCKVHVSVHQLGAVMNGTDRRIEKNKTIAV